MSLDGFIAVVLKLVVVLVLVLLNGFFVAAEFAIVKIRATQLEPLLNKGNRRALIAKKVIGNLDASLSATQLGITLASLGLGWVAEPIFASLLEPVMEWVQVESEQMRHSISFAVGFSVITFLHIVLGELAPKSLAIQKPLPVSLSVAQPLMWFYRASYPFIWALNSTSLWLLRRAGIEPASEAELMHSEEELRLLFSSASTLGGSHGLGRDIVLNALDLRRRIARDVMRPRQEMEVFSTDSPIEECIELAERTRYSRFPLTEEGDLDRTLGVVHFKDLIARRQRWRTGSDLRATVRPLLYVPETARLEKLLELFLDRRLHFAIVVDEFGGTVGMVTLENILEELVGQIQDEFDQEQPLLTEVGSGKWAVSGALPLHELAELTGETLEEDGITTVSGWVTRQLGGFPVEGNIVAVGDHELEVQKMDGPKVAWLELRKKPGGPAAGMPDA